MQNNYTLTSYATSRLDPKDAKIVNAATSSVSIHYGHLTDPFNIVQMHIYDLDGNLIKSVSNLDPSKYSFETLATSDSMGYVTKFYTDPVQNASEVGLLSGTYKAVYNFLYYYLAGEPFISSSEYYTDSQNRSNPSTATVVMPVVPWYIEDISTSRRELRVVTAVDRLEVPHTDKPKVWKVLNKTNLTRKRSLLMQKSDSTVGTFLLDFGDNDFGVVINQTVSGDSLLFKLYKPLPDYIEEKDQIVPVFEAASPIEMYVNVVATGSDEVGNRLRGPNTSIYVSQMYDAGTEFKSWNDLLSTSPQTSRDILDHFLSSSNFTETVNVDYSDYRNFVHFSSAEERVRNFQYKLQLLEQYDATLGELSSSVASGSTTVSQNINYFSGLKSAVLNGFDGYENWLYWESGSSYSSSLGYGPVTQSTWPKSNSTYPYSLYSVTSSQGVTWFDNQVQVANDYDRDNQHNLIKTIPFHLREDDVNNESYLTFLQMIGQHYDLLWTYAKGMTQRYELQHKANEGTAKDVIWDTMKSFGMDLTNGHDVDSLWKYAFGTDVTSSYAPNDLAGQSGFERMSSADATKEVWKRLLNNLSYLLKTKGTVRGIKALITCYGIPSTILRVKEYGGPDPDLANEASTYIVDEFTYTLDFDGRQIVSQSWFSPKPNSVEFRFLVNPTERTKMTLMEAYSTTTPTRNFKLSIVPNYSAYSQSRYTALPHELAPFTADGTVSSSLPSTSYVTMSGYFLFEVSGGTAATYSISNEVPVYNGAYWSVLLERTQPTSSGTYNLWAKQAFDGRIVNEASFSVTLRAAISNSWDTANVFAIGSSSVGGQAFTGNMQEFRLWTSTLNEDVFNNHVVAPLAYNGNTYSSSYHDLALRWRMNNSEWYSSGGYNTLLLDSNPGQSSTYHGYWSGSASASVIANLVDTNYYESPSIGFRRMVSNKVRIDPVISKSGELDRTKRVTETKYDRAPIDSNKVGIYLAPTEVINEDIIRTFAGIDYDDFIGAPLDRYETKYSDLIKLNSFYWTKYGTNPNIYTYMRVLSYFDKSLYGQIRKMVPARVELNTGFLFEPHLLERAKIATARPPEALLKHYSSSIDVDAIRVITFIPQDQTGSLYMDDVILPNADSLPAEAEPLVDIVSPEADGEFYTVSESLATAEDNPYSYNIMDMTVMGGVLTMNSSSVFAWSPTGSIINPACDFWLDIASKIPVTGSNGAITGYSGSHYIFHRQRFTSLENLYYDGCVQTVETTPDKGLPFESFEAPPNVLVVVDSREDKPRLNVE